MEPITLKRGEFTFEVKNNLVTVTLGTPFDGESEHVTTFDLFYISEIIAGLTAVKLLGKLR
jgi:hypothetical protein